MPGILQERISQKKEKEDRVPEDTKEKKAPVETNRHFEYNDPEDEKPEKLDYLTEEDISQLDQLDEMMSEENFVYEKKRKKIFRRISMVLLTAACSYLVVLIYGSFITEFYYDDKGEVAPVIMSVSDISDKNEYNSIVGMYLQTRSLYETLLTLDYRMAAGTEDSMSIAPEYEATLDTVSALTTQIDAAVINSKYTQIKNMLLTWVQTHAAAYCQYMSAAITQNDSNAANEAIAARQVLNDNFQLITQNIVTLGGEIKGYDLTDIENWSPDGFVQQTIEGVSSDTSSKETEQHDVSLTEASQSETTQAAEGVNDTESQTETEETESENIQSGITLQTDAGGGQNG